MKFTGGGSIINSSLSDPCDLLKSQQSTLSIHRIAFAAEYRVGWVPGHLYPTDCT